MKLSDLMSSYGDSIVITNKDEKYNLLNLWLVEDALEKLKNIRNFQLFGIGRIKKDFYIMVSKSVSKINDLDYEDIDTIIKIVSTEMKREQANQLLELPSFKLNSGL
jgi:hypothetical protein